MIVPGVLLWKDAIADLAIDEMTCQRGVAAIDGELNAWRNRMCIDCRIDLGNAIAKGHVVDLAKIASPIPLILPTDIRSTTVHYAGVPIDANDDVVFVAGVPHGTVCGFLACKNHRGIHTGLHINDVWISYACIGRQRPYAILKCSSTA